MSHWYMPDGTPVHTVIGKDGNPRPTTLRDARKLGLLPSVTTVMKPTSGSPILTDWIVTQALVSALNHPGGVPVIKAAPGDTSLSDKDPRVKAFTDWCKDDSRKQVRDKAELGGCIHDALKQSFLDPDEVPAHFLAHVDAARRVLAEQFGDDRVWHPERSFGCVELGVGGCIDLDSDEEPGPLLGDFKCKEFDGNKRPKDMVFDEHVMQLGGYRLARTARDPRYANARCFNVFVSTSVPGLVVIHHHTDEDMKRGEEMFLASRAFWRAQNKYTP